MRKKLLKSLLVTAALCVGANAWAETFTGSVSFEAKSRITNNNDGTFTTAGNAGNGYALALADLSGVENITGASSVTLAFDVNIPSGSRWNVGIGDKNVRGDNANGSSKSTYKTEGLFMSFGTTDGKYFRVNGGTNNTNAFGVDAHCTFTFDVVNKKYSYTITNGETNLFSGTDINTSVSNATVVEAYSWLGNSTIKISNVSYSFEYTAASYNYSVNAVDENGNLLKEIVAGVAEEPTTVVYPYAISIEGEWYTTTASTFGVTVNALNPTATVTYVKDETIVAFFEETTPGTNTAYSNGGTMHANAGNSFNGSGLDLGTFDAGKYQISTYFTENGNRGLYVHNNTETIIANLGLDKNSKAGKYSVDFVLVKETNLNLTGYTNDKNKPNQSADFDYILIRKIGDAVIDATIGAAGYSSFASAYAVNLDEIEGATAYYASAVASDKVTLTKATGAVAAGTGLILKGEANASVTIPAVAEGSAIEGNKLVGCVKETVLEKNANYYVLVGDEFQCLDQMGATIPAGKAYLNAEGTTDARLSIVEGETNGISNVNAMQNAGEVYNLQGQRMVKAVKGLYIVNGKKVVLK